MRWFSRAQPRGRADADHEGEAAEPWHDTRDVLREVMHVPRGWVIAMTALAIVSSLKIGRPAGGGVAIDVEVGTVAVAALALIWLPCVVHLLALTGGTLKAGGVEASAGGLLNAEELVQRLTSIRTRTEQLRQDTPAAAGVADSVEDEVNRIAAEFLPAGEMLTDPVLAVLAREYERVRSSIDPGTERTIEMNRIVNEARVRARAAPDAARALVPRLLRSPSQGDRIVGLALAQEASTLAAFEDILRLIAQSATAFEMYHALLALDELVPLLSSDQRAQAKDTLLRETRDPRGVGVMRDPYIPAEIEHLLQRFGHAPRGQQAEPLME
jgi:hypothetical protein